MSSKIHINHDVLSDFCQRYRINKLSLFGSVLREDFDPNRSDIDVLIDFGLGADRSLFAIVSIQDELKAIFGHSVHVCTPGSLSKYFRDEVVRKAEQQYVAA